HLVEAAGLRRPAEDLAAVVAQQRQILDPHAAPPGQVDAGLHAEYHAGAQDDLALARREPRGLVHLQPDPVAQAVAEVLAISCACDHVAREGVRLLPRYTGADG